MYAKSIYVIDGARTPFLKAKNRPGVFSAADLATHVRTEFSTYRWLLEPMIERAGFTIEDRHFRRGVYGSYTCRKIA